MKDDALAVLQNIIAAARFDFEAQIKLALNARDPTIARAAATAVYDNSEDPELAAKAARYLGRSVPDIAALPALGKHASDGLHVVLIALPPCDVRLLADAAALYEKITGIAVTVLRLSEHWEFDWSGRIPDQRLIQQVIIQKRGPNVSFNGWTRDRYKTELLNTVTASDALTKFNTEQFVEKLDARPDQYDAGMYVMRLAGILDKYRLTDDHVIYVGVTGADLFAGDTNFIFGTGTSSLKGATSIVSYYRMTTNSTGERYESRKRLTERLAKRWCRPRSALSGLRGLRILLIHTLTPIVSPV